MALVNQYHARSSGGQFILRFDYNQLSWINSIGTAAMLQFSREWVDDLAWLAVVPDVICYQSELAYVTNSRMRPAFPALHDALEYGADTVPVVTWTDAPQYPYAPYLTAEVVICDNLNAVDMLIAGEELLDRFSLYMYMAGRLHIPVIKHVYLPRLRDVETDGELDTVSKTRENWKIRTLREDGMTADDVTQLLRRSCMIDATGDWNYPNIKPRPRIQL